MEAIRSAVNSGDYELFERLTVGLHSMEDDLLYDILAHEDERFWEWAWDQIYESQYDFNATQQARVIYERLNVDLASSHATTMIYYFLTLPPEQRNYRFMYEVMYRMVDESGDYPDLSVIFEDPLLVAMALDIYGETKYDRVDIEDALGVLEDTDPSDAVDEVSEMLEQWLERH